MKFRIDLKVLFFFVLFFFTKQLKIYLIIMGFALLHELSHLIVGMIFKFKINELKLMPFGFFIKMQPNFDDYKTKILRSNMVDVKKIFIAIAGPLFNFICIFFIKNKIIIYSNLVVLIFNIIPIYPLDGGRILKSIFRVFLGKNKSEKITIFTANFLTIVCTIVGIAVFASWQNISLLLFLMYLWYLVINENKRYKLKQKIMKIC